jgi:uncharacterized protein
VSALRMLSRSLGWPLRVALLTLLGLYRLTLAPLTGPHCRFHPSCSAYAEEAIRTHGPARGSFLAVRRFVRCSPLSAGGLDPVPTDRSRVHEAVIQTQHAEGTA